MENKSSLLIETSELAKLVSSNMKNLTIVDGNFGFKPEVFSFRPHDTWNETYKQERIPTARFINTGAIGDASQNLPNMLPTLETFTKTMRELDVGKNDHIIVYGDEGAIGPCRLYWMFKVFGLPNVQLMNGTFAKWKREGLPVEKGDETWQNSRRDRNDEDFQFTLNKNLVVDMDYVRNVVKEDRTKSVNLIDARTEEKFNGGHVPGAHNILFYEFLGADEAFKSPEEIRAIVETKKIDISQPVRTSCGSGMTACVLWTGFNLIGAKDTAVYDGSWAEWSKHTDNPIEKLST